MRARGLKRTNYETLRVRPNVALRASAWIETRFADPCSRFDRVALRASAWIETVVIIVIGCLLMCRAPCERVD